jgi:hypothetical protein
MGHGHQRSAGRRSGSTSAVDGADVVKVLAVLTAVALVIGLVIALVLLVLTLAALGLLAWGTVALVRRVRAHRRNVQGRRALAQVGTAGAEDDIPVHTLAEVLTILPPHLRGDFTPPAN